MKAPTPKPSIWDRIGPSDPDKPGLHWPLGIFSQLFVALLLFGVVATAWGLSNPETAAEAKRLHPHTPGCVDSYSQNVRDIGANIRALFPDKAKPGEPLAIPPVEPSNAC